MISVYDDNTLAAALALPLATDLARLLRDRWDGAVASGLADLSHILIIQPGDGEAEIELEIGFRPTINPIDGIPYGDEAFRPSWAWLEDLGDWYELIVTIGNSGFAFVLLVEKAEGVPRTLLRMCQEHAQCA